MIPPFQPIAIIWDLDGTLADTAEAHFNTWKETLAEEGIVFERDDFYKTFGQNNFATIRSIIGHEPDPDFVKRIGGRKEERFRELVDEYVKLLPGARDCLQRFNDLGFLQAIGSSAPMINIQKICESTRIQSFFAVIVAGDSLPPKPDPMIFFQTAQQMGKNPSDCLVIEDSRVGIQAAKAAGMHCLAVATTNPVSHLQAADIIIPALTNLDEPIIQKIING
ncbi:MAG TPA: HAD family phosphatase, partial [Longilinea sp.]|nr:HAD family phosphatase [Longilinea sp.]